MRLEILVIGRARAGPERELYENYARRIRWPLKLHELEEKRPLSPAELKEREGALILGAIPRNSTVLALDEGGCSFPSGEFARLIANIRDEGRDCATFVIDLAAHAGPRHADGTDLSRTTDSGRTPLPPRIAGRATNRCLITFA
jgi:23S rRNA (pseudouridine1915-N3)-methyltransferase